MEDTSNLKYLFAEQVNSCSDKKIYNTFHTLFKERGMIQQELADGVGVSKAYISPIVHGKVNPPLHMKLKIAEFLKIDTRVIWEDQDE